MQEIKLKKDVDRILKNSMINYLPDKYKKFIEISDNIKFFSFLKIKNELIRKYKIYKSKEFLRDYESLYDSEKEAIQEIISLMEDGQDWLAYYTKNLYKLFSDGMLYDWNIIHLHLNNETDKFDNNFKKRTGKLLFIYLDDNNAYFLKIEEHKEKPWVSKQFIEIAIKNWDNIFDKYKLNGIGLMNPDIDSEQKKIFRKNGINTHVQLNGQVYAPMGGGITLSGDSLIYVVKYTQLKSILESEQKKCVKEQGLQINYLRLINAEVIYENDRFWIKKTYFNVKKHRLKIDLIYII